MSKASTHARMATLLTWIKWIKKKPAHENNKLDFRKPRHA